MHELSLEQVNEISLMVSNSEITYSHLSDDLVDHICCDVESELSGDLSYKEAFERVKSKFGVTDLQKIQEDTIMLIDQKYRFMKTTMKIFGNVALALVGIGTIFKLLHWPSAGILLTLGFASLALLFYPATILANFRKSGRKRPFLSFLLIVGGIAFIIGVLFKVQHWPWASILLTVGWLFILAIFLPAMLVIKLRTAKGKNEKTILFIGVLGTIIFGLSNLFKIMHWPGAGVMTIIGAVLLITFFLPMYSINLMHKREFVSGKFIYLVIVSSMALILVSLLNLNMSRSLLQSLPYSVKYNEVQSDYYHKVNDIDSKKLMEFNASNTEAIHLINAKADTICEMINNLKQSIVENNTESSIDSKDPLSIMKINNFYDSRKVSQIMMHDNKQALKLRNMLSSYLSLLQSLSDEVSGNQFAELFDLNDRKDSFGNIISWEERTFNHVLTINALVQLTQIEQNVRMAESLYLKNQMQDLRQTEIQHDNKPL